MSKRVILVPDGMADEPLSELGGATPLEAAHTPHLDALAREGLVGVVRTVPEGMPAGSDVANLAVLGYDPRAVYTGRAPIEAASIGVELGPATSPIAVIWSPSPTVRWTTSPPDTSPAARRRGSWSC